MIDKVLSSYNSDSYIYYECVKGSYLFNLELFTSEVSIVLNLSYIRKLDDIFEIFEAIARECKSRHMVVVIEEYPYIREQLSDGVVDSYFQRILDNMCSDITLIISVSTLRLPDFILLFPSETRLHFILSLEDTPLL